MTSVYTILANNRRQHLPKAAPEEGSADHKSRMTQTTTRALTWTAQLGLPTCTLVCPAPSSAYRGYSKLRTRILLGSCRRPMPRSIGPP